MARSHPRAAKRPPPLTQDAIVRAAVALADRDGLAAVSLRNVAAALAAGPMRIYTHVATKQALLELMVDAVYAEMPARLLGPWRRALRIMATHVRTAARAHPWFVELIGMRPHQGPHARGHLEASLAAVTGAHGFADIDLAVHAIRTVYAFVIGALWSELVEDRDARTSGMSKSEWQEANWPELEQALARGKYPAIERVVASARHLSADAAFERGLDTVLDGLEVQRARAG